MQVHQSTFQRTLLKTLVTDALVNGKIIRIKGGNYIMPGGDGTGPRGMGPIAGRGPGYCVGYCIPEHMNIITTRLGCGR